MMLIKTKPFQDILNDYSYKVGQLIEKEVTKNREQLSMYLTHPRIFRESLSQARPGI
jgi:hypothetical protein